MVLPTHYEIQAAAQEEFAGDRSKQEAFAKGVAWALEDAESDNNLKIKIKELEDRITKQNLIIIDLQYANGL